MRFANEQERIKNALTPTNRDLLNHIRNAELAAGLRIEWEGREETLEEWTKAFLAEVDRWETDEEHLARKELVYVLLVVAQRVQEKITQEEKG